MKVTGNVKYIPAGTTQYIVDGNDGQINVDTSVSAVTIVLPNIINSGYANTDKGFIINDISNNAATNNITLVASNNTVNSQSSVLISVNGGTAKCSIASMNEWFVITEPSTSGMSGTLTANYIPKAASSSTLTNSIIYQDGHNIAIGTTTAAAKLHIKGADATSANYALKVDNSASSALLYVANNGSVGINGGVDSSYALTIGSKTTGAIRIYSSSFSEMFNLFDDGKLSMTNLGTSVGIGVAYNSSVRLQVIGYNAGTGYLFSSSNYGGTVSALSIDYLCNSGFGTNSQTAKVHIVGTDATSSNYALKIDNSASSPLLYVRNDGNVYSHGFGGISSNAAFGLDSLIAVSGLYNSAFGTNSLKANSTGVGNCAFGFESLKVNTSGDYSTSMGTQALYSNITGASNTAIGNAAMALNVSGASNTAIGKSALYNSTVSGNTAIGNQSLQGLSTGSNNTAIGNQSGLNATGSGNVFIGYLAGASETGSNKFFIDNQARTNEATARVESLIVGTFDAIAANQILAVNVGKLQLRNLQTGNAGLATGDMYIDTAANILANGDKVIGWKV